MKAAATAKGLTAAQYAAATASKVLKIAMGPVGWAIAGIGILLTAVATNFLGIQDALKKTTSSFQTNISDQVKSLRDGFNEQRKLIEKMVSDAESKYAELEGVLAASYESQLNAAQQAWLDLIDVTASGWDEVVSQYESYYSDQLADLSSFYDQKVAAAESYLNEIKDTRDEDLAALELQFLKEKQAIEESGRTYATKQIFIERLEKKYNEARAQLNEDYRVQELEAEKKFNDALPGIEAERAEAIEDLETKKLDEIARIREEERSLEETHAKDMIELEKEKQSKLETVKKDAYSKMLDLEKDFDDKMVELRRQMYEEMRGLAATQGLPGLEEEAYAEQGIPAIYGQHGYEGWVRKPTLFVAGEKGAEYVSIVPRRRERERRRRPRRGMVQVGIESLEEAAFDRPAQFLTRRPEQIQPGEVSAVGPALAIKGPLIQVMGSMDKATAAYAVEVMKEELKNVVIEASSSQAPTTHKKITLGGAGTRFRI
jgi:hypothetical protein